jgi:hypothetical protein
MSFHGDNCEQIRFYPYARILILIKNIDEKVQYDISCCTDPERRALYGIYDKPSIYIDKQVQYVINSLGWPGTVKQLTLCDTCSSAFPCWPRTTQWTSGYVFYFLVDFNEYYSSNCTVDNIDGESDEYPDEYQYCKDNFDNGKSANEAFNDIADKVRSLNNSKLGLDWTNSFIDTVIEWANIEFINLTLTWNCKDGYPIPKSRLCDGNSDCSDSEDEDIIFCFCRSENCDALNSDLCNTDLNHCMDKLWKCHDGLVIQRDFLCNGEGDCSSNEDEDIIFCNCWTVDSCDIASVGNGLCEIACKNDACFWDGGDCDCTDNSSNCLDDLGERLLSAADHGFILELPDVLNEIQERTDISIEATDAQGNTALLLASKKGNVNVVARY